MPCDSSLTPGQSLAERVSEIDRALKRLEAALSVGSVRIVISPNGAVTFAGWNSESRARVADVCAFRTLTASGSPVLRMAVARAEAMQGRKVNVSAVAAGVHSHDDGRTWNRGH